MTTEDTMPDEPEEVLTAQTPQEEQEEEDYKSKYLRLLADMENMRKRMVKEKQESVKYSLDSIVCDFLTPLDNLESALKYTKGDAISSEVRNWAMGFEMIATQFKEALAEHGVTTFDSIGTPFNPHLHQALEMIESEGPENVIIEECTKGYKREDRIIRPARVKVSKNKTSQMET